MKIIKYNVTFLLDKTNLWFEKQLRNFNFGLSEKYNFKISKNNNQIKNQDIVFPISYTKILSDDFLKKNKLVVIAHTSKLPKDRGFAPLQYQILRNKKIFYISLIKAVNEVDAGPIYYQSSFKLNGTELNDEIRKVQGRQILKIIKKFLIKYPKNRFRKQKGKGSFNKRRNPEDSEININKSIIEQFNLFRISDNNNYPVFFRYKGHKYILKIFKEY